MGRFRVVKSFLFFILSSTVSSSAYDCDIAVLGGTASGVGAAITASREGKSVCFITRVKNLKEMGGMITSGLNLSDSGIPSCKENPDEDWEKCSLLGLEYGIIPDIKARDDKNKRVNIGGERLVSGLFDEYRNLIYKYYKDKNTDSWYGLRHEPHIAGEKIEYLLSNANKNITFYFSHIFDNITKKNNKEIESITIRPIDDIGNLSNNQVTIKAKYFIDATVTGDLASASGVTMTTGREGTQKYNEGFAGELYWNPKTNKFLKETPKESNLDSKIQAYSYFLTVKKEKNNSDVIPVEKTKAWKDVFGKNYTNKTDKIWTDAVCNKDDFDGSPSFADSWGGKNGWSPGKEYYEINVHPKGSDLQEENYNYHSVTWLKRVEIEKKYKQRALCFIKYWQSNDENISLATTFYNDGIPYRMYIRESRRMIGHYVFKEQDSTPYDLLLLRTTKEFKLRDTNIANNIKYKRVINKNMEESIGFTDYPMDSHAVTKYKAYNFYDGKKDKEGIPLDKIKYENYNKGEGEFYLQFLTAPGVIPLGTIVPKEIDNLFVTTAVSASHVGYGTLRMEPIRMLMGQVASVLSSLAIQRKYYK
ncbi:MAG: FAD-dependent oxidoreductase [Sulfurovum sp.]